MMLWLGSFVVYGQRSYKPHSVLASGNWYKVSVSASGIHKLDIALLQSLGINASSIDPATIRIFGNGGRMLPENCNAKVIDDLREVAIMVIDGGDGRLDGADHILFYAQGPGEWGFNSSTNNFEHHQNLYSRQSYYYINTGDPGLRVRQAVPTAPASLVINSYDDLYHYELDTFNFLSSGKQWFGEEFSEAPGKTLVRNIDLPEGSSIIEGQTSIRSVFAARSFGSPSTFNIGFGGSSTTIEVPAVATGPYDQFARTGEGVLTMENATGAGSIEIRFNPGSSNAQGWLDLLDIITRRSLEYTGNRQLSFRDRKSVSAGNTGRFEIKNPTASMQVWDVTVPNEPVQQQIEFSGEIAAFTNECSSLKEYVAFDAATALKPIAVGRISNQDLHEEVLSDYLVIAHPTIMAQAQRLAEFHQQKNNLAVKLVSTEQVFNEFSSGIPDPTAIRDFVKMQYDRSRGDSSKRARFLLLFGDGSFDYLSRLNNNTNLVPVYESSNSLDPLSTYTSDDFFGFLDDADYLNGSQLNLLDIGIGRIPASNEQQAKAFVDKLMAYHQPAGLGQWRNEFSFIADDEDGNLHLEDAESIINNSAPFSTPYNFEKIYLDAFPQESTSSGTSYPQANLLINNRVYEGTLVWNYNGHGGYRRLAEEIVLDQSIINSFNNPDRLPLFVTATCDVAPYDNPLINSIGENLILREKTGAIALMTTTRLVFAFSNRIMNQQYIITLLKRKPSGEYLTLGEAGKYAKNQVYQFFGDVINNRKFTLLGDPAMRIAFPQNNVVTTAINGRATAITDTLKALSKYTISGEVRGLDGSLLNDFNGTVYPVLFEKPTDKRTLGNDPGSIPTSVKVQENRVFRGSAQVIAGKFNFSFVVPKDINYQIGNGKLSYYADNGSIDANGVSNNLLIGGTGEGLNDQLGPELKAFLNDEKFINGSITNEQPVLLLKLFDSSGINILGKGIGHDLVARLDNDPSQEFVLNNFYQSDLNDFQKGIVKFQLPKLAEGNHSITIKAWDVANNSSEISLDFRIVKDEVFRLDHVLNYPNPFTTRTTFWFDHNRPGEELNVQVQVFTVAGRLVKTIRNTIFSTGNRSSEVEWDGRDDFGGKLGRGVYIYNLRVRTKDGKSAEKIEKLYLL